MGAIEDAVPHADLKSAALSALAKGAVGAIPLAGPVMAEALGLALDRKQIARQEDFNRLVARELEALRDRAGDDLQTLSFDVDEFVALVTRAQREASETASEAKRRRLAASVANGGSWAPFTVSERSQFGRLVAQFDELHVFLLHFFVDPRGWLVQHDLLGTQADVMMGPISGPLAAALNAPEKEWFEAVSQAARDVEDAGLAAIPLRVMMSGDGALQERTNPKGRRFLEFINESDSAAAATPALT